MVDVESIKNQIKAEIRVDLEGKGMAAISATARLCGVSFESLLAEMSYPFSALVHFLETCHSFSGANSLKDAEIQLLLALSSSTHKLSLEDLPLVNFVDVCQWVAFNHIPDWAVSDLLIYYAFTACNPIAYCSLYEMRGLSISLADSVKVCDQRKKQVNSSRKRRASPKKRVYSLAESFAAQRLIDTILEDYEKEVTTPSGRIDVLTSDSIYEVKVCDRWKEGVGQLCAYGVFYQNHNKVLVLFDHEQCKILSDIKYVCAQLGIDVLLDNKN